MGSEELADRRDPERREPVQPIKGLAEEEFEHMQVLPFRTGTLPQPGRPSSQRTVSDPDAVWVIVVIADLSEVPPKALKLSKLLTDCAAFHCSRDNIHVHKELTPTWAL